MSGRGPEACRLETRRQLLRDGQEGCEVTVVGIDYLEVSDDQTTLTVHFIGRIPRFFVPDNFVIEGGVRERNIVVHEVASSTNQQGDGVVELYLDRPGDFSTYTLRLVADRSVTPHQPYPNADPRYDHLDFSFKVGCPTDGDCASDEACPERVRDEPVIDYLAKDYASFRQLALDRIALLIPGWTERHAADLGIALVELFAYVGDHLSYWQDAVATEAYLDTAKQRISVRRHARLVDYRLHEGCNARAWIALETNEGAYTLPPEVKFATSIDGKKQISTAALAQVPNHSFEVFEQLRWPPDAKVVVRSAHNAIAFYTWGDEACCLPAGATRATLVGSGLVLAPGDVLVFEEVLGPKTGLPQDADPTHRHAVRLVAVKPLTDPLTGQAVLDIEWHSADALPFPLCLTSVVPEALEDHCGPRARCVCKAVSVARGNVVLVDHGETQPKEPFGPPCSEPDPLVCCEPGAPEDRVHRTGRIRPRLQKPFITHAAPLPAAPASGTHAACAAFHQDPREATACVWLTSTPGDWTWECRNDLLDATSDERVFVAEIDNRSLAWLRFGAGGLGRAPAAGETFNAKYRVGNGVVGNVPRDSITTIVIDATGTELTARNPLPARGGIDPEPIEEAKLFAPEMFKTRLERAVTAEDYATLAGRAAMSPCDHSRSLVQRAAARLAWSGSWYEVEVALDPLGRGDLSPEVRNEVEAYLEQYRRIGHDLWVGPGEYVPLFVALEVCVLGDFSRAAVKSEILRVLFKDGRPRRGLGIFHPDALTFDQEVPLASVLARVQGVPGVASVRATRFERMFDGPNGEIAGGRIMLGPMEIARLDADPSRPENGVLRLDMRGGR